MTVSDQQHQIKDANKSLEIRVFTLNIWGLPSIGLAKDRRERVEAIAQHLASAHEPYHYVFLQEVWFKSDYRFIADKLSKILPYSHYFYSGVIGSGMCIFSCSPIQEVHFHRFSLCGLPHKLLHGDWYGGKGLGLCKTTFHRIPLLLVNTHFHAEYDPTADEYIHHRVSEAFETSQILRLARGTHSLAIFGGDLNCTPADVPYRLLTYNTDIVDTFLDCALKPADGVGATNETPSNSYTPVGALRLNPTGNRIDYIFYWVSDEYQVKTLVQDQPLPHRVPQTDFSFSDHEGVRAVLSVRPRPHPAPDPGEQHPTDGAVTPKAICFNRTDALLDASAVCAQGLRVVARAQRGYAVGAALAAFAQATLLGLLVADLPSGWRFFVGIGVALLGSTAAFCGFIAAVWCSQERHAVLATKSGLECLLEEVRQTNARYFEVQRQLAAKQ